MAREVFTILDLLQELDFTYSHAEGRRLLHQGAVTVNGVVVKKSDTRVRVTRPARVRVGKMERTLFLPKNCGIDLYEVVSRLVGPIDPVGDSGVDRERLRNLKEVVDLVERLVYDIHQVSDAKDRPEASMAEAGRVADECLENLKAMVTMLDRVADEPEGSRPYGC